MPRESLSDWAQQMLDPLPITYDLSSIASLLRRDFFIDSNYDIDVEMVKKLLEEGNENYCKIIQFSVRQRWKYGLESVRKISFL